MLSYLYSAVECCSRVWLLRQLGPRRPLSLSLCVLLVCRSIKQTGRRQENVLRLDVLCRFTPQKYTLRAKNGAGLSQEGAGLGWGWGGQSLNTPSLIWVIWTLRCTLTVCPSV